MKIIKNEPSIKTIELTNHELLILNNILNEVCNGSYSIDDTEFGTLIGADKDEVLILLKEIGAMEL